MATEEELKEPTPESPGDTPDPEQQVAAEQQAAPESPGDTPDPESPGDTPDPESPGDTPDPEFPGDTPDPGGGQQAEAAPAVVDPPAAEPPVEPAAAAELPVEPAVDDTDEADDGEESADEEGSAEGETSEAGPAEEGAAAEGPAVEGDGKKKRRRRRRRKKKGDEEGGEAESPVGGATAPDDKPSKPKAKKKKVERDRPAFNVGDEVFGRVSNLTRTAIWVDVAGGKATGLFDRTELIAVPPRPGEQFIAKVKSLSTRGGMMVLGRELYDTGLARSELRAALQSGATLDFWVTGVIKGGLEVDYKGVRCFAPASHVDRRPNADLSPMLGEPVAFVVTHYGKKGRDVVVSRKQMIEEEHKKNRGEQLVKLQPEMEVKALVRTVLQWGAFVALPDFGDIEGVVHMSEASHDRSARLGDVFKVGAEIQVKILKIDEKGKLWLSHKATLDDPWGAAAEKYAVGTRHKKLIVRLTDFGAFIQLEPGIDGLCHIADLSFTPIDHPSDVVKVGDEIEVVIANLDSGNKKITLHPAPPEEEKDAPRVKRLAAHQKVDVVVVAIRDNGIGVRIVGATGRHARGYIHAGQTGTPRGTNLRKSFPIGTRLEAKVVDVDARRGEAKLSIRALKEDAEKQAYRDYRKKVQREATFGTFADLLKGKI